MTRLRLSLDPLDTLFFRDARPFGPADQADSGLPTPQTLTGAIRTLLLELHGVDPTEFGKRVKMVGSFVAAVRAFSTPIQALAAMRVSGPWFGFGGDVLAPVPANLRFEKGSGTGMLVRLDPMSTLPLGWQPKACGMLPLWYYGRTSLESRKGYLKPAGLQAFLNGAVPDSSEFVDANQLYSVERRVGIAVDSKRNTVVEGMIYSAGMLSLKPKVTFEAIVSGNSELLSPLRGAAPLMKFGGEGRRVVVRTSEDSSVWMPAPDERSDGRLLLLTTPAWFEDWKPKTLNPVAAAIAGYEGISGWDLAKGGPKPNRFMVTAGSVYFLPKGTHVPDSLLHRDDTLVGWGQFLEGNWTYVG